MKLTNFIKEQLYLNRADFQWKLIQNSNKKVLELFFTFRIEPEFEEHVEDIFGQKNKAGYIQFEDALLFYDPKESITSTDQYLYAIPVATNQGVEKGMIEATLKHLILTINAGRNQLREFLRDPGQQYFELEWNEQNFLESVRLLKDTNRYDNELLDIDFEAEESLMDELKEKTNDGVERV